MQEQFTENANSGFYKGFLKDLGRFGTSNATAWLNIRKRMFERTLYVLLVLPSLTSRIAHITLCSRAGGGVAMTPTLTQVSTEAMDAATAEFAQSTGLTDSEGEGEDDSED